MDEISYKEGQRQAYGSILDECIKKLGYSHKEFPGEILIWISEREKAISQLRDLCSEFGDNEWDDNLHLADIIEKHLGRHLIEKKK